MERMRNLLSFPKLRIPTLAQLRDGTYFKVKENEADSGFSYVKEFEIHLAKAQEVALWSNPITTVFWLVVSQMLVYHFTCSPLLPNIAKLVLAVFIYFTWVYRLWPTIRVPPEHPEDTESFTPLHPDVLSAPEISSLMDSTRHKVSQIISGLCLLHYEQPGKFCLLSSTFCVILAITGMQCSTAFFLHTTAFLAIMLPGLLVRAQKVPSLAPGIQFVGDFLSGLGDLVTYRGLNAPPLENKDLDDFVPEVTKETESFLEKALSYVQKKENDLDLSLASGLSIPSHEEVEFDSLNTTDLEVDLLPTSGTLAIEQGVDLESDDDCDLGPTQLALTRIGDFSDDEEDSLDLEPSVSPVMQVVASSVTSVTASVSSVTSTVSSVTSALLGTFLSKTDSEPDLEDFELVSESDFDLETPKM